MGCKPILEPTNAGHYFSECSCGWSGGVYRNRTEARSAWHAHVGQESIKVEPVKPVILISSGGRLVGTVDPDSAPDLVAWLEERRADPVSLQDPLPGI